MSPPEPPATEPGARPEAHPRPGVSDADSVDELLAKELQLRGQRRYADAATLLERASRRADLTRAQRQRFSFELGQIMELDGKHREACAHFERHAARFPEAQQNPDMKRALATCGELH